MTLPKRLIVEYEDGSTKGIEFDQLDKPTRSELSRRGLCPPPSEISKPLSHYFLLRWRNGWQEVIGVDKNPVDLLRYYILERVEEIGRMALDVKEEYPLLLIIKRLPKELDRLMIVGSDNAKVYHLEPKTKREEGDKIEHVEFDKAECHFQPEPDKEAEVWLAELTETLRNELSRKKLSAKKLLNQESSSRVKEYKELAKALGLRATESQEDVYGFIQLMIKKIAFSNR
jgi:hypothetical protein